MKSSLLIIYCFIILLFFAPAKIFCVENDNVYRGKIIADDSVSPDTTGISIDFEKKQLPLTESPDKLKLEKSENKTLKLESSDLNVKENISSPTEIEAKFDSKSSVSDAPASKMKVDGDSKPLIKKKSFKTFLYILGAAVVVVLLV